MGRKSTRLDLEYTSIKDLTMSEYHSIHKWIRVRLGAPKKCSSADCDGTSKRFEWALKNGEKYKRDTSRFISLCKKCHYSYDRGEDGKMLYSYRNKVSMDKIQQAKYIPIGQYGKDGKLIKVWDSATHAESELGISRKSIGNNIQKLSKSAGGFIWKRNG